MLFQIFIGVNVQKGVKANHNRIYIMNAMTHCFPVDENTYKDDDVVATVRALRPQLNHEIIEILVPRKTKLYARFVRRLKIVCNVYADYSN